MSKDFTYIEDTCRSALYNHKAKSLPYNWDINVYRGCSHGCKYCYAMYSHRYMNSEDYFGEIHIKKNIAEVLERELSSKTWKREVVNLGGVTDNYQPAESTYKIMPDVWRLLIKYKTPAIISTKSDLILRDFDLIEELASITYVNVAETITTMDEGVRKVIEPGSVSSKRRFEVLRAFSKTKASTALHMMPIIPYITDGKDNIEVIFKGGRECNISYVLPGVMYLRGKTREVFFSFLQETYPGLYEKMKELYKKGGAGSEYKGELYGWLKELQRKYGLSSSYSQGMKERLESEEKNKSEVQLSLF